VRAGLLSCAIALLGVSACDQAFGLNSVTFIPDAAPPMKLLEDPNGDYDGDGILNGMDKCPLLAGLGTSSDQDGDGVGDLCDPHPTQAGDCLVLFDDFGDPALASAWKSDPTPLARESDTSSNITYLQFDATSEQLVWFDSPLAFDTLVVKGYVQAGDNRGAPGTFAIQIFTDLVRGPLATGVGCGVESDGTTSTVSVTQLSNGTTTGHDATALSAKMLVGPPNDFEIHWSSALGARGGCQGTLHGQMGDPQALVEAPVPTSGRFGIRGVQVGLHVYAVAAWGHCP